MTLDIIGLGGKAYHKGRPFAALAGDGFQDVGVLDQFQCAELVLACLGLDLPVRPIGRAPVCHRSHGHEHIGRQRLVDGL